MIDLGILRTNPNIKIVITDERMEEDAVRVAYYPPGYKDYEGHGVPEGSVLQEDGYHKHERQLGLAITGETDWYTKKAYGDSRLIYVHPAGGDEGTADCDMLRLNGMIRQFIKDLVEDQGGSGPTEIFLPDWEMQTYISIHISYRE
jgi:hypothetical protein